MDQPSDGHHVTMSCIVSVARQARVVVGHVPSTAGARYGRYRRGASGGT